jgi:LysM repeat protein
MNHQALPEWVAPAAPHRRALVRPIGWRSVAMALLLLAPLALGPTASARPVSAAPKADTVTLPAASPRLDRPVPFGELSMRAAVASSTPTELEALMDEINAAWNAQDWALVLDLIDQVIAIDPSYDDIQSKRYYALINYGYELLTAGQCTESLEAFREALLLQPEGEEALMGLDLVSRYCPTPVPGSTNTPGPSPTVSLTPAPHATPTPVFLTDPITYTVQVGDTLYSLSKRYSTTVQAIMQANGMMSYFLRAGDVIWIPASGSPPPGPLVHIVQPGETLYSIAQQYSTTVWAIMAANNLTSSLIWAYRALYIPTVDAPGPTVHIVSQGETLSSIARSHDTTVALLMLANHLQGYTIYPYQRLIIPPEGWSGWPELLPGSGQGQIYRVVSGDTLFSISQRFGVTVHALMAANGLTSSFIRAGSYLRIP